jgi:hypothetical protein
MLVGDKPPFDRSTQDEIYDSSGRKRRDDNGFEEDGSEACH